MVQLQNCTVKKRYVTKPYDTKQYVTKWYTDIMVCYITVHYRAVGNTVVKDGINSQQTSIKSVNTEEKSTNP